MVGAEQKIDRREEEWRIDQMVGMGKERNRRREERNGRTEEKERMRREEKEGEG